MDEGFDLSAEYDGEGVSEEGTDAVTETEIELGDEASEISALIETEPESLGEDELEDFSAADLLDPEEELDISLEETLPEESLEEAEEIIPEESLEESLEETDNPGEIPSSENLSEWISDINPNFDEFDLDSPYCNNCGSCAYAVYQRLEGNTDIVAGAENIPYDADMEALTGLSMVSMPPGDIEKALLAGGDGAHAIIGIDRTEGAGHWFNAVNMNGVVKAVDGQTGEIRDWPPDYGDVSNWEMSV